MVKQASFLVIVGSIVSLKTTITWAWLFYSRPGVNHINLISFDQQIEKELLSIGAKFETYKYEELINNTSEFLSNEKAIGWFQGRMEFGPRALGGRSILGDPRSDKMQKNLNLICLQQI